jgi:hypothetical protein
LPAAGRIIHRGSQPNTILVGERVLKPLSFAQWRFICITSGDNQNETANSGVIGELVNV